MDDPPPAWAGANGPAGPADFDSCFESSYPRLLASLSAASDDAPAALEHAFTRALLHWRRVGSRPDPAGWVRRVAVRRLLSAGSARYRRAPAEAVRFDAPPNDHAFLRDAPLADAIAVLPLPHRVVLALHYVDNLAAEQIADTMGTPEALVASRLAEARTFLRIAQERDRG